MFAYAFTFLVALAVTFVLTPVVKNFAIRIGAVDKPDARKVHHGLVPRLGGLAIYAGFMVSAITTIGFTYEMVGIMAGATFLIIVGVADDVVSLRPKVKLLGQIIAAAIPVVISTSILTGSMCHGMASSTCRLSFPSRLRFSGSSASSIR